MPRRQKHTQTLAFVALLFALFSVACVKKPYAPVVCTRPDANGCVIEDLDVRGSPSVPAEKVKERLATVETSRPLAGALENVPILSILDRLQVEYSRLDPFVLERDLGRVERYYRAQGYYEAHARAARVIKMPEGKVRVEIAVEEGAPVKVAKVSIEWKDLEGDKNKRVLFPVLAAERKLMKIGNPFQEEPFEGTKKLLLRAMTDNGFAYAEVTGNSEVDLVKHEATVTYTLTLGPHCTFGPVKLTGIGDLPEAPLRAALDVEEGDDYSTAKLDSAQLAIANFGVLGSIDVVSETSPSGQPQNPVVPVTFKAQKTQLRGITLGMGAMIGDQLEVHGRIGWEHRNLLGGLRHFTVDWQPGFILYPVTITNFFSQAPTRVLPQLLVRSELQQPLWFSPRTKGIVGASFHFYRLQTADLVSDVDNTDTTVEENIVGYREVAGRVGVERKFWENRQYVGAFYNIQFDNPFSYNFDEPPPGYVNLVISYVDLIGTLDLRKNVDGKLDPQHPHKGVYFSNDIQIAGIGGDVRDLRIRPEFRLYIPITKKVTLGYRAVAGLLFPRNYGDTLQNPFSDCSDAVDEARARDLQILQFRAFFSGGPSSNRGYPTNGVGPQEDAHFLSQNAPCHEQVVATGGLTLWESSLEGRFAIVGALSTVVFVDGSDLTRETGYFRLTSPHLSAGFGIRYDTPVGPLRGDLGYRIPCMQVVGECKYDVPVTQGQGSFLTIRTKPNGDRVGIPFAFSIAIGEAF